MKRLFLLIGLLISVNAFAGAKGITTKELEFDNSKQVKLREYGTTSCKGLSNKCIMLGAFFSSKTPNLIGLDVFIENQFTNIQSLELNIDGQIVQAEIIPEAYSFDSAGAHRRSFPRFTVSKDELNQILNAQNIILKATIDGGMFMEKKLIDNGKKTLAFEGLERFKLEI